MGLIYQYILGIEDSTSRTSLLSVMYLVVVACLVAVAYAKNCCSPAQWEGKLGIVIASNSGNGSLTEVCKKPIQG